MLYRALLVDDDLHTLFYFEQILRPTGLGILKAGDGEQALELLYEYVPALVVLDLLLPRRSGLEVLQQIATTPGLDHVNVIVVSSQSRSFVNPAAPLARALAYLVKPVSPRDLRAVVQQALAALPG
ncbi:MAG: response regulator [Chloroflexi bacterium]|nr:response regulator [Chloroflexota bacterium]